MKIEEETRLVERNKELEEALLKISSNVRLMGGFLCNNGRHFARLNLIKDTIEKVQESLP